MRAGARCQVLGARDWGLGRRTLPSSATISPVLLRTAFCLLPTVLPQPPVPSPFFQRPLRAGRLVGIDLSQSQVNLLAGAKLPREPIFKVHSQSLQVHAEAHLDQAIYGKSLIKSRASGETPHKETIQPGNGAGPRPLWTQ